MSFVAAAVIAFLEKELADEAPEIQAYVLQMLGTLATELVGYVEKKIAPTVSVPATGA